MCTTKTFSHFDHHIVVFLYEFESFMNYASKYEYFPHDYRYTFWETTLKFYEMLKFYHFFSSENYIMNHIFLGLVEK